MIQRRLRLLMLALISLMLYYSVFFDLAIAAKDSLVNMLDYYNLTTLDVPVKKFNGTSWVTTPFSLDLVGLIDFVLTLIIVFAPLFIVVMVVWR